MARCLQSRPLVAKNQSAGAGEFRRRTIREFPPKDRKKAFESRDEKTRRKKSRTSRSMTVAGQRVFKNPKQQAGLSPRRQPPTRAQRNLGLLPEISAIGGITRRGHQVRRFARTFRPGTPINFWSASDQGQIISSRPWPQGKNGQPGPCGSAEYSACCGRDSPNSVAASINIPRPSEVRAKPHGQNPRALRSFSSPAGQ